MAMDEKYLKRVGVDNLLRSEGGRRYIAQLQKKHRVDILQPRNPDGSLNKEFEAVYGRQIKEAGDRRKRHEEVSRALWERRAWELEERAGKGTEWKRKRL